MYFVYVHIFGLAHAQIPQEIWKESEQIEKQIKKTSFPDRVYNIKDFGAKKETGPRTPWRFRKRSVAISRA